MYFFLFKHSEIPVLYYLLPQISMTHFTITQFPALILYSYFQHKSATDYNAHIAEMGYYECSGNNTC